MTIEEMHIWVRQYGQQMGLQNIRGLLPEQIDLLLNTSIIDELNMVIQRNLGLTNDRVATDNSKIGQINALSTLYQVNVVDLTDFKTNDSVDKSIIADISKLVPSGQTCLYAIDADINYQIGNIVSSLFPVRIIDHIYLASALQDAILKPRKRAPIAVIYNGKFELFCGKDHPEVTPNELSFSYIKKPNTVKYDIDLGGNNVDCDMPEYMHVDICKHAVELYQQSLASQIQSAQGREQAQRREMVRNQAQPTPYGEQGGGNQEQ